MKRLAVFILLVASAAVLSAASKQDPPVKSGPLILNSPDLTPIPGRILTYKITKKGNGVSGLDTISVTCAGKAPIPELKVESAYVIRNHLSEVYYEHGEKELYVHKYAFTKQENDVTVRGWIKQKRLAFPLKVGAKWKGGSISTVFGISKRRAVIKVFSFRVVKEETVEVPAGKYRCLKVELKTTAKGMPAEYQKRYEKAVTNRWYAKGIGIVKLESMNPTTSVVETRELTKITEPGENRPDTAIESITRTELSLKPGRIHYYSYSGGGYRGTITTSTSTLETFLGDFGTGKQVVQHSLKKDAWIQNGKHPFHIDGSVVLYQFPLTKEKKWQARRGRKALTRKVTGPQIIGTPFRSYVSMRIETRDAAGKLFMEEWVVPAAGIVKWTRHRMGASETYSLEYLLEQIGTVSPYRIPFVGEARRCTNAWAIGPSRTSHRGWERFAVDFYGKPGTPVYSARGGTVVEVKNDSRTGGNSDKYIADANFIIIRHEDDSYGVYYHMKHKSVKVKVGEKVKQRRQIGKVGLTGWTSGAHLHFHVHNGITTLPVTFRDIPTDYGIPKKNKTYTPR